MKFTVGMLVSPKDKSNMYLRKEGIYWYNDIEFLATVCAADRINNEMEIEWFYKRTITQWVKFSDFQPCIDDNINSFYEYCFRRMGEKELGDKLDILTNCEHNNIVTSQIECIKNLLG